MSGQRGAVLLAAYHLPRTLVIEQRAADLVFRSAIGVVPVDVVVPRNQDALPELDTDNFRLRDLEAPPLNTGAIVEQWIAAVEPPSPLPEAEWTTHIEAQQVAQMRVKRLLLRVHSPSPMRGDLRLSADYDDVSRVGDELFRWMESWYDVVRSWVEVHTAQDLDYLQPRWDAHVEGAGLATFDLDGDRVRLGGRVRLDNFWEVPASPAALGQAFSKAGTGTYPPLEHVLLRDGRAAWHRGHYRRAVIDAASALESSLLSVADRRGLNAGGKPLGGVVRILEKKGALKSSGADRLRNQVINVRNRAIHGAADPGAEVSRVALETVGGVVNNVVALGDSNIE